MDEETESRAPLLALVVLFIGAAFVTMGVVFLTYGIYVLVRTGDWPDYPVSKMLDEIGIPTPHIAGLDWLFAASACTVLLAIGVLLAVPGVWLIARRNRRLAAAESDG